MPEAHSWSEWAAGGAQAGLDIRAADRWERSWRGKEFIW